MNICFDIVFSCNDSGIVFKMVYFDIFFKMVYFDRLYWCNNWMDLSHEYFDWSKVMVFGRGYFVIVLRFRLICLIGIWELFDFMLSF